MGGQVKFYPFKSGVGGGGGGELHQCRKGMWHDKFGGSLNMRYSNPSHEGTGRKKSKKGYDKICHVLIKN